MSKTIEIREASLRIEDDGKQFVGTAANAEVYDMGEFREQIMPSAFENLSSYDVRALVNHDSNQLLARSKFGNGSLLLEARDGELMYVFEMPDTQVGRDTKTLVERGDISGSSWAFRVEKDTWSMGEDGVPLRQITEISELRDISLVTYPANPSTDVAMRSLDNYLTIQKTSKMEDPKKVVPAPAVHRKEAEHNTFSLTKAIRESRSNALTGLEAEISTEGYKQKRELNLDVREEFGFHFPSFEKRGQTVTAGTQPAEGGQLVETVLMNMQDALWAGTPTLDRVSRFSNLRGNVDFPTEENVPTLNFETEIAEATEQTSTFGKVSMSPKRAAILMSVSNQLLRQDYSSGIQQRLLNQMSMASQVGLENAILNGDGTGANPTGIYTELVGQAIAVGAGLDYDALVDFESALANQDALRGNLAYITHPAVTAYLKKDRVDAGSGILTVGYSQNLKENMSANGYSFLSTTVSPIDTVADPDEYGLLFGNLNDAAMGFWGGISVMSDPYTRMSESVVRLYIEMFTDVAVLRPESFALSTDITI